MKLLPKYEAALIAYICIYDNCSKEICWDIIGKAVRKYGKVYKRKIVYRGHAKANREIRNQTPFFSTTPVREFAQQFVEKDWDNEGAPVGHLFRLHLDNVRALSTRDVTFTYSPLVKKWVKIFNGRNGIYKEREKLSFEEYWPMIPKTIRSLITKREEEILVLNGGTFIKIDDYLEEPSKFHIIESLYTFSRGRSI